MILIPFLKMTEKANEGGRGCDFAVGEKSFNEDEEAENVVNVSFTSSSEMIGAGEGGAGFVPGAAEKYFPGS